MSAANDNPSQSSPNRWYGEQDENGVDLSLIRENLRLSPSERLLRGDRARRGALQLLEYGRRQRERNAENKQAGSDRGNATAPSS